MSSIKIAAMGAVVLLTAGLVMMVRCGEAQPAETTAFEPQTMKDFKKPESGELKKKLSAEQFAATQQCGTVGYSGGTTANPVYADVSAGGTGHAEAIQVEFDSSRLRYEELLNYFFRIHDPTTPNRQHNDVGTQYRSAIFYASETQKQTAERVKAKWDKSGKFNRPIVTEITAAGKFYPAEEYHQKYLVKHPGGYTCHVLRDM